MAVVSQFQCPKTSKLNTKGAADEAIDRCTTVDSLGASIDRDLYLLMLPFGTCRLSSVGLGSIPTWMRPFEWYFELVRSS